MCAEDEVRIKCVIQTFWTNTNVQSSHLVSGCGYKPSMCNGTKKTKNQSYNFKKGILITFIYTVYCVLYIKNDVLCVTTKTHLPLPSRLLEPFQVDCRQRWGSRNTWRESTQTQRQHGDMPGSKSTDSVSFLREHLRFKMTGWQVKPPQVWRALKKEQRKKALKQKAINLDGVKILWLHEVPFRGTRAGGYIPKGTAKR